MFDTPYGDSTTKKVLGRGITSFSVNGEDHVHLMKSMNNKVPKPFRSKNGWYTPVGSAILALLFPNSFTAKEHVQSDKYFRENFPDVLEEIKGIVYLPTLFTSKAKHKNRFFHQNKNNYIELETWTDEDENVPLGTVLIKAALGGDPENHITYFQVNEVEYITKTTMYGFVCILGLHEERELS